MFRPTARQRHWIHTAEGMAGQMLRALDAVPGSERVRPASLPLQSQGRTIAMLMRRALSRDVGSRRFILPETAMLTHGDLFVLGMQAMIICDGWETAYAQDSAARTDAESTF